MNEIEKLTQALRDNEDLSFGGIRTLQMIEDAYKRQLVVNVPEANVQPQLYEVRTDGICFICKKPTQNLSPDPTNWRIDLPFNGGDGLTRQYHQGCLVALIDKHFV